MKSNFVRSVNKCITGVNLQHSGLPKQSF